jgi:hypothetical protein
LDVKNLVIGIFLSKIELYIEAPRRDPCAPPGACGAHTCVSHTCAPWRGRTSGSGGDPDGTRACSTRPCGARHHDGFHRGPVRASTEAFAPLMMGRALYKGAHTLTPPHFHLILGLQLLPWLLVRILGGSLGAHPHLFFFFFPHKLNI